MGLLWLLQLNIPLLQHLFDVRDTCQTLVHREPVLDEVLLGGEPPIGGWPFSEVWVRRQTSETTGALLSTLDCQSPQVVHKDPKLLVNMAYSSPVETASSARFRLKLFTFSALLKVVSS